MCKREDSNSNLPFFMCAQHGQQLEGESTFWDWYWELLASDKGFYREVGSEGSWRQSLGLMNTNYIQGLVRSDDLHNKTKSNTTRNLRSICIRYMRLRLLLLPGEV